MPLLITEVERDPQPLTFQDFLRLVQASETPVDALLTVSEIAEFLRIPRTTFYSWINAGLGPRHIRVRSQIRVRFNDFVQWIEENTR